MLGLFDFLIGGSQILIAQINAAAILPTLLQYGVSTLSELWLGFKTYIHAIGTFQPPHLMIPPLHHPKSYTRMSEYSIEWNPMRHSELPVI